MIAPLHKHLLWLLVSAAVVSFPFGCPPSLSAENKVITKNYYWQIKSIPHFDVYYYGATGRALLPYAEEYLESAYRRADKVLPASPEKSFPFLLYNNHNDFEETNVTTIGEGTGGVTEAFKDRLAVGNIGSQRYLEYVTAHETIHEFEYVYLFSGFWRSIRLLKFVFYPNWLMEGLAEYSSGDLDSTTREMYVRDASTSGRLFPLEQLYNFGHVMPHQVTLAYKESEYVMHYLADEYGRDKLPAFLASFEDHFDVNTVLINVIGADLAQVDRRFREYMEDRYTIRSKGLSEPSVYGSSITATGPYPRFYVCPAFSPDSRHLAYISDETGTNDVYVMDLTTLAQKRLWGLEKSIRVENIHDEGGGLSYSPDGRWVAFAGERIQKDHLYLCSADGETLREIDPGTETVDSPAFGADGDTVYFSGIRNGFRDIYAYSLSKRALRQLTDDPADQLDTVVSPDGSAIVFAAERKNADGRTEYDLCRYELNAGSSTFLTSLPGDERFPCFSPDGRKLYFTSDQDGINDIYVMDESGGEAVRLTRVIGGNFQPRISPDGAAIVFSSFRRGERRLFRGDLAALQPAAIAPEVSASSAPAPFPVMTGTLYGGAPRPYRFRASTDLFFPALFYSSLDGLYIATYWQASEFMGNHQLASQVSYASGAEYLDYQLSYGYLKYRPQVYFNATGQQYYWDVEETIRRREESQSVAVLYPLNRFQSIEFIGGTIARREDIKDDPAASTDTRENIVGLAFFHTNVRGPYLDITSGHALQLVGEFSGRYVGGDYVYQNFMGINQVYYPLGREQVLLWKVFGGAGNGPNAGYYRLGGDDRVRGVPANAFYSGHRTFVNTFEWRFPLVYNINYHLWFIFPDFFFKTMYGTVFVDTGVAYNNDDELSHLTLDYWKGGYGVGVRVNTFILQSYPLLLNLQVARRMDSTDTVFYLNAGGGF